MNNLVRVVDTPEPSKGEQDHPLALTVAIGERRLQQQRDDENGERIVPRGVPGIDLSEGERPKKAVELPFEIIEGASTRR